MIAARCPSCNAALPDQVEWCGLCYADLRPRPAAAASAPARPPAPAVPAGRRGPLSAPIALLDAAAASPTATPRTRAGWPCPGCGVAVPLELAICADCGLAFLAPLRAAGGVRVPVVGDLAQLSRGGRFGLAGGAALVLIAVFVGLAALAGLLL